MVNVNFNSAIESLLVPDKRTKKTVAFNNALVAGIANNYNLLTQVYKDYTILPIWAGGTYAKNDLVKYGNSIFQSVENNNQSQPTYGDKWRLVSDNFLGSDFRLSITGSKLNLEYALNTWFETTFRQPSVGVSDIYLTTNNVVPVSVFRVGINEFESTNVYTNSSEQLVVNSYNFTMQYNLTINIPVQIFLSLGSTKEIRNSIVRSFADKYINAGLTYKIEVY